MMIHEVSGDILLTKAQAIAHGVAPNDHFDQGLAAALHEKWPIMVKEFRHYAHQTHPKPGELWAWGGFGARVFSLMTQEGDHHHGSKPGKATTAHVNHSLKRLRHDLEKNQIKSVALPKLATGVGGLGWDEVLPLIRTHLGDLAIPVYVYTHYQKGVQANEPGV
jgi:O-acetyl-ADP-ribose deacetylase (regulator of RNase III)